MSVRISESSTVPVSEASPRQSVWKRGDSNLSGLNGCSFSNSCAKSSFQFVFHFFHFYPDLNKQEQVPGNQIAYDFIPNGKTWGREDAFIAFRKSLSHICKSAISADFNNSLLAIEPNNRSFRGLIRWILWREINATASIIFLTELAACRYFSGLFIIEFGLSCL